MWLQMRGMCRFEHPAIRRNLKFYRYGSIVVTMLLFTGMIALIFIGRLFAASVATAQNANPDTAANSLTITLLPYLIGMIVFAFIAAEVIYYAYRAYLLKRL